MLKRKKNNINENDSAMETESPTAPEKDIAEEKPSHAVENGDGENKKDGKNAEEISGQKKLEIELEKKIKEIETLTDTMKRRQADFENYKKRMVKTQEEQKKLAIKDFALDIININDDLLRAFDAACNIRKDKTVEEVCSTFSDGFLMISKRIEETLKRYSIEEIDSLNKPFDPNFNEAVEIDESESVDHEMITKVHQKGFRLDDYVLRAAKVKVTKPLKKKEESAFLNSDVGGKTEDPGSNSKRV